MFDKKNKFMVFMKKQGFYIVLVLCILAVGGVSYLAVQSNTNNDAADVGKNDGTSLEEELNMLETRTAAPSASASATAAPSPSASAGPQETKQKTAAAQKQRMVMPVKGEVAAKFTGDDFVFNKTLSMWSTHNGIDIKADAGSDVVAALPGTVKDVYYDNTHGNVVVISHSGDVETVYLGMEETSVEKGSKVNASQKIGTVGVPPFEAQDGAHLHFEYYEKGEARDPKF